MVIGEEFTAWMSELETTRCWELLDRRVVGRVGFAVGDEQIILPVNYVVEKGHILIRTGRSAIFDRLGRGATVAFEIDDTDQLYETGWSVLVKGRSCEITDPNERSAVERLPLYPWAMGPRNRWIKIIPDSVTGRAISRLASPEGHVIPFMPPD